MGARAEAVAWEGGGREGGKRRRGAGRARRAARIRERAAEPHRRAFLGDLREGAAAVAVAVAVAVAIVILASEKREWGLLVCLPPEIARAREAAGTKLRTRRPEEEEEDATTTTDQI